MNSPTTDAAATCGCACGEAADGASTTAGTVQTAAPLGRRRVVQLGAAAVTGALTVGLLAACGSDDKDADGDADGDKAAAPATSPSASATGGAGGTAVAKLADVAVGATVVVDGVAGDPLVIYRSSETAVTAFSAKCTHKFCPVKVGTDALDCPCHGSTFDLKTGARLSGVATEPLPPRAVAIKGDDIVLA